MAELSYLRNDMVHPHADGQFGARPTTILIALGR